MASIARLACATVSLGLASSVFRMSNPTGDDLSLAGDTNSGLDPSADFSQFVTREALENSIASHLTAFEQRIIESVKRAVVPNPPSPVLPQSYSRAGKSVVPSGDPLISGPSKAPTQRGEGSTSVVSLEDYSGGGSAPPVTGVRAVVPIDLEESPYLPVTGFSRLIEDGFRERPFPGAGDKPHRYNIELDPTYQRLIQKTPKLPTHKNESLLEYQTLYCSTFYLSCCGAALAAICEEGYEEDPQGGERVSLTRDQVRLIGAVTNTLSEVESSYRERIAYIRYKHEPQKDSNFESFLAQRLHQRDFADYGSRTVTELNEIFDSERQRQVILQLAKSAAKKGSTTPKNSRDEKEKEKDKGKGKAPDKGGQ